MSPRSPFTQLSLSNVERHSRSTFRFVPSTVKHLSGSGAFRTSDRFFNASVVQPSWTAVTVPVRRGEGEKLSGVRNYN